MNRFHLICCLTIVVSIIFFPYLAAAQKPYFEDKTLTLIVGTKPGGIYDRYARMMSKYLSKHLPGNPVGIVQNMPGGGHMTATNHVYSAVKPDGQTILAANPNVSVAQLTKVSAVNFDIKKMLWIGATGSEGIVLTIRSDLPYKTIEDLKKATKPIMVGTTGPGAATHDFPALLKEFLGLNFEFVAGYPSTRDILLAIERKEVDVWTVSYTNAKPVIDRGVVRPMIRDRGAANIPGLENIPVDEDLVSDQIAKTVLSVRALPALIGRPYAVPPGTPADVVKLLRSAFEKALKDPQLIEEAGKSKMPLGFMSGDEVLKAFSGILDQPENVVQELVKYIKFGE